MSDASATYLSYLLRLWREEQNDKYVWRASLESAHMKLAFYNDFFEGLGIAPAEFDGVAVVQDGLLKSLSWVFTPAFTAKMGAAMAQLETKAAAARYMEELWNQGDLAVADELLADDFVSHNHPAGDRAALKDAVAGFRAENPNAYFTYDDISGPFCPRPNLDPRDPGLLQDRVQRRDTGT
jgi:hypothetical protein